MHEPMFQHGSSNLISFPWTSPKHVDQSVIEPFTLAGGLQMVQTSPYLPHPHQLTEVSHQLTLKISSLIH